MIVKSQVKLNVNRVDSNNRSVSKFSAITIHLVIFLVFIIICPLLREGNKNLSCSIYCRLMIGFWDRAEGEVFIAQA